MQPFVYRHELKHEITLFEYHSLLCRLSAVLPRDPHAGPDGSYWVRSLYFDNADNLVLRQKLDGLPDREKFRIRYYNWDPVFLRLEKKSKRHGLCSKLAAPVTKADCSALLQGDIDWMRESENAVILELYAKMYSQQLRPRTIVDYRRVAFLYHPGNVRVTLDTEIRCGMAPAALFEDAATLRADIGPIAVLEVKYDSFLPEMITDLIQLPNRSTGSFSKYAACRNFL